MRQFLFFLVVFLLLGSIRVNGQSVTWEQRTISSDVIDVHDVYPADLDGDGDLDIVAAASRNRRITWHENQGGNQFIEHLISEQISGFLIMTSVFAADLDGDGDMDIATASSRSNMNFWYKNDGSGNFGEGVLFSDSDNSSDIYATDLDDDGDVDVITTSDIDREIVLERNDGNGNFERERFSISEVISPKSVFVADLDLDGDVDVMSASFNDDMIGWYKNKEGSFTNIVRLSTEADGANSVFAADLDNDGDMDVLSASGNDNKIAWYKSAGNGTFDKETIITTDVLNAVAVQAADLDNDGDMDVISASNYRISWYENDGKGNFSEAHFLGHANQVTNIYCIDMDNDGDIDVLCSYFGSDKVVWHQNLSIHNPIKSFGFYDLNENGVYDANEKGLLGRKVLLNPINGASFTNKEGNAEFFVKFGEYQLTPESNTLWELTSTPETYNITVTDNSELPTYHFGFRPTRILHRVYPYLGSSPTRCSQKANYWLNYSNTGTTFANGTITLEFDELIEFVSSNPEPDLVEGRKITWNITDLPPSSENKISCQFQMPDFNSMGEFLETQANLKLFNKNQELVYTKSTNYKSEVLCSYDPNDKLTHSNLLGQSEFAYIKDTIYYTIRFQNTGNDVAFNIRVEDVLDKKLDWTTFHPITASHDYRTELNRETGLATFFFDDIMLPDSTANEVESHGFVTFAIASLKNIGDKTEVENTASIFFDFNPAIVTNTVVNTLIEQVETDIEVLNSDYSIRVFPNPFSDHTSIEVSGLPQGNYRLEVMDILGRKVRELSIANGAWKIERRELESGVYLFRVVKKGNNKVLGSGKVLVE